MINVSDITKEIEDLLKTNPDILQNQITVQRSEFANLDPNNTPWLGIYRAKIEYDPNSLGRHSTRWRGVLTVRFIVQAANDLSGATCEEDLESYIEVLFDALWSDPSLNNTVLMMTALNVEYSYKEMESETMHFQWAVVTAVWEVDTG
jgi:hypothetical protein